MEKIRKITQEELKELQGFKGVENGIDKFLVRCQEIYADCPEFVKEIQKYRDMNDSLEWITTYPAYAKTENMYRSYIDDFLEKIGYHEEEPWRAEI